MAVCKLPNGYCVAEQIELTPPYRGISLHSCENSSAWLHYTHGQANYFLSRDQVSPTQTYFFLPLLPPELLSLFTVVRAGQLQVNDSLSFTSLSLGCSASPLFSGQLQINDSFSFTPLSLWLLSLSSLLFVPATSTSFPVQLACFVS